MLKGTPQSERNFNWHKIHTKKLALLRIRRANKLLNVRNSFYKEPIKPIKESLFSRAKKLFKINTPKHA